MLSFFTSSRSSEHEQEGEDIADANCAIVEVLSLSHVDTVHVSQPNSKLSLVTYVHAGDDNYTAPRMQVTTTAHPIPQHDDKIFYDETHTFGLDLLSTSDTIFIRFEVREINSKHKILCWGQTENLQSLKSDVDHELQVPLYYTTNQKSNMVLDIILRLVGDVGYL